MLRALRSKGAVAIASLAIALGPMHGAGAVTTRQLVEVVDISGPVVSPDGTRVAFRTEQASIERDTYDSVWYVQPLDGSAPAHRVADGGVPLRDTAGESLEARAEWSPDGRWIYFRALLQGRIAVWRAAADGTVAEEVTSDPADVRDFALAPGGDVLVYTVGATREQVVAAEQDEYDRGIHLAADVPIGQALYRSAGIEGRWATQRYSGLGFDRVPLLASEPDRTRVVDLATGEMRDSDPGRIVRPGTASAGTEEGPRPWKSVVDGTGKRVAELQRVGDDPTLLQPPGVELSIRDAASGARKATCTAASCVGKDIATIQWRPGTDEVLFYVTDAERGRAQSVFRWDASADVVLPVADMTGLVGGGRRPGTPCGLSRQAMVCVVADARNPPRVEKIDIQSGERLVLFDPNAALAHDMAILVDVSLLRWTDGSGQSFTGQYFRARTPGEGPAPLFVNYYSCPGFVRGGLGDEWPFATLARHGVSALCINYAPLKADAIERFDQALSAVRSAVELLAARGEVDPDRVGMGGLSFGSSATMWVAMNSDLLAAASVASGVISPSYYLWGRMKGERFLQSLDSVWGLGALDETPERWRTLSPAFNLERIRAPVLFQVPEQEYLFSLDYAIPMIQAGRADLFVFPNEPHQKFQPRHKLAVYDRNLDWFRFWLQRHEDPTPTKQEQYAHWRHMEAALRRPVGVIGR
ncbi:Atxe2 family lasso peptide isopeptidase [Luteimonas sp. SDU82]|uniref:Atxe2 family lasso peptide isopeptidase n=1 Tax=Luteimonas sp. SDU82 TaxID=3422592 RepID=UPI003EBC9396